MRADELTAALAEAPGSGMSFGYTVRNVDCVGESIVMFSASESTARPVDDGAAIRLLKSSVNGAPPTSGHFVTHDP